MAFQTNEKVSITVLIEGDKARNELAVLEGEAKKLERALKEAPKGTQEWAELYKELGRNQDAQKALRQEVGLTGMTMTQLEREAKSLVKEMKNLTPGTEEYIAASGKLKEVNGRIVELRKDYKVLDDEIEKVTATTADWDDENKRATLTTKQLKEVAAQLGKEIDELVPGTKEHAAAVQKLDDVNKKVNTTLTDQPSRWKRAQDAVVAYVGAFSIMSAIEQAFNFIKEGITDALALGDSMADVAKSTGMATTEVAGLSDELDKLDTRTAKEGLMDIAKVGGQLGVANTELLGFVKSVDMAVVALGDEFTGGAEEAAKEIGALQKLFKETRDMKAGDAINDIGSSLNALGAAGSATAPVVADFTQRIGQLGDLSPQIGETMGLGAAFQELGLSAEISAGGITNILLSAAKSTDLFAQQLGISEVEMKKLINTKPNEFLLKLADSLRGLPADQVAKRLDDLGIKSQEATKVMSLLKDQTGFVREKQDLANKALKEGTSLMQEFTLKNSTGAAELAKTQKNVQSLAVDIGMKLIPFIVEGTKGFLTFVNVLRAAPEFIEENKSTLISLGVALVAFNAQTILAEANTLRLAAAEKIATIQKEASAVAQRLLNTAMTANPIALVVTAVALLVAGFMALYDNSLTVRAGVNGLFEALKVGAGELVKFWNAITSLNFAEAATIMSEGGKKIAEGYNKGFDETIAAGQPKQLANHKKLVDDKKTVSVQGAVETGTLEALEDQKTLDKKAEQAKKHREEQDKANADLLRQTKEAQIAAIADELTRERAKLQFKRDNDVAAVQASVASEQNKAAAIAAIDGQLKADLQKVNQDHVEKVRADQQKALDMMHEYQLALETDEKRRKELDAEFRYEKEKNRIQKEITDETQKAHLLTALQQTHTRDLEQINTEFRNREREANNAVRSQEQAAELAQYNLKELNAGNNASKLLAIKKERLDKEYEYLRENLRAERESELARIQDSNMSQEQKTAAQKAINDKYLADVGASIRTHTNEMTALDKEAIEQKNQRYQAFSSAFKSLLQGDFQAFAEQSANIVSGEKKAWQERMSENMAKYNAVAEIAQAGVNFLNKLTQDRLDKEIAASKKETDTKLADNKTRMEAAIKAAEDTAEAEKLAAGDSAEKIKDIEEKLATSKADIREQFEDEADSIRKDGATKEKALAKQKWEADKRAQVATAIISGAQAALKALASGIFPVNLVFAGIIAGLTAVQVAKIKKQPTPEFRDGGLGRIVSGSDGGSYSDYVGNMYSRGGKDYFKNAGVLRGSRHGSKYGQRGIAMIDRQSGQEVGEAEDGEPFMILSRNTYGNNKEVIDKLLYTSLHRNGKKIAYRDGGVGSVKESPYFERKMYLFGSKKAKREAEQAARDAEAEAKRAEAEAMQAEAAAQASYDGPTSGDEGDANGTGAANGASAEAEAQAAEAKKMAQTQLDLLEDIGTAVEDGALATVDALKALALNLTTGLKALESSTELALEKMDLNLQATLEAQTLAITEQLQKMDVQTGTGLGSLSEDINLGLKDLGTLLESALEKLGTQTETKLDDLQTDTVTSLEKLELTTKETLVDFQKENSDKMDELIKATVDALADFQKEAVQHIDELATTTEAALDSLQTDTVTNLKELSGTTKSSLDSLANQTLQGLNSMADQVGGLRGSINGVEGAVRGVEGAVYGTNQSGRLDALLGAISSLK
ncbi:hypothetical protein [Spirosoma rigui]|uniref:hypothetical protein n=1 Tax=Spirosoma rigui TaxID=564064 RepID=UPI0009AFD97A|nr:hypothetical protein [Spirosoma rigui]